MPCPSLIARRKPLNENGIVEPVSSTIRLTPRADPCAILSQAGALR
jgi:hypothetical protein